MPRYGSTPFSFPAFGGATRRLILINLIAYFLLAATGMVWPEWARTVAGGSAFAPWSFLSGAFWQPFSYSLVHPTLMGTAFELLSLWFLAGFLENIHPGGWIMGLYGSAVLGTAAAALALWAVGRSLGWAVTGAALYGCFGGIFGLLVAIGTLYADTEFLLFFAIGIKAKYMAAVYALISMAMLFGEQRLYAFAQLGGALAGLLWIRSAPRRGLNFAASEGWYGLRNRYYRWKRRRAARKFEVYMRKHGRTVHYDGNGRQIHDDDDRGRWN
jgi:hypothetical protein